MIWVRHAAIGGVVDGAFARQRNRYGLLVENQTTVRRDNRIVGSKGIDCRMQRTGKLRVFVVYGNGFQYRVFSIHRDSDGSTIEMRRIGRWNGAVQSVIDRGGADIRIRYCHNLRSRTCNHATVGVEDWSTQVETIGGRRHGTDQICMAVPYGDGFQRRMSDVHSDGSTIGNCWRVGRWFAAVEGVMDGYIGSLIRNRNRC